MQKQIFATCSLLAALAMPFLASHASPDIVSRPDWDVCESPTDSQSVQACTRIIAQAELPGFALPAEKLAEAYRRRGLAYRYPDDGTKPEYEKAMSDLNKARELDPKRPQIYIDLGSASGYADEKLKFFRKAIELDPRNAIPRDFIGRVYMHEKKDYASALAWFKDAIRTNQDEPSGYADLGDLYFTMKQYQQAVDQYSETLSRFPKIALVNSARGAAYLQLKQYDKALQDYRGGDAYPFPNYLGMCKAHFKMKAYEETVSDCNESDAHTMRSATDKSPPMALISTAYMRATALKALGREEDATKDSAFVSGWTRNHPDLLAQLKALDPE